MPFQVLETEIKLIQALVVQDTILVNVDSAGRNRDAQLVGVVNIRILAHYVYFLNIDLRDGVQIPGVFF